MVQCNRDSSLDFLSDVLFDEVTRLCTFEDNETMISRFLKGSLFQQAYGPGYPPLRPIGGSPPEKKQADP